MDKVDMHRFNPFIIAIRYFNGTTYEKGEIFPPRHVYDYEIEYIVDGNGFMITDGVKNPAQAGMVFFRRPRQINQGIMQYKCYLILFDVWGNPANHIDQFTVDRKNFQPEREIDIPIPEVTRIYNREKIENMFKAMYDEYLKDNPIKQLMLKSYFYQIVNELVSFSSSKNTDYSVNIPSSIQKRLNQCLQFIEEKFTQEMDIAHLASMADLSTSHFHRVFKVMTGLSPIQYILNRRMTEAKRLLTQTDMSIKEICYDCGFDDVSYFCKLFKQKTGCTPLNFKMTHQIRF